MKIGDFQDARRLVACTGNAVYFLVPVSSLTVHGERQNTPFATQRLEKM